MSLKGFKTKLDPNNEQRTKFAQHAGIARYTYNWGLQICYQVIDARKLATEKGEPLPRFPSSVDLHKKLNTEVKPNLQWFYDSSKCAPQQALRDLDNAWKRFLKVKGSGAPKRKKKFVRDGFYLDGSIQVKDGFIQLPRIGLVRLHEAVCDQQIKNVRITRKADNWFVSFKVEFEPIHTVKTNVRCGVDLGIKTLATLSDGTVYPALKPYKANKTKLATLQRKLARQVKGGKNREKTKRKIAKLHARIANIRNDVTHKLTSHLAKSHSQVVIEDLNVSGLLKNHCLAGAIADAGFGEFRRQLEYKCQWYGSTLIVIERWYPSSQLCSCCGHRQPMALNLRVYDCSGCGVSINRDLNAAKNIKDYSETAVSSTVEACETQKGWGAVEKPTCRKESGKKYHFPVQLELKLW